MEPSTPQPSVKSASSTIPIRVHKSTARSLKTIANKLNRKAHGRKVKVDQIVAKAISLLQSEHLEQIKQETYTSGDRIEIEFKQYCKRHGPISKEEFLSRVLAAALPQIKENQPSQESQEEA